MRKVRQFVAVVVGSWCVLGCGAVDPDDDQDPAQTTQALVSYTTRVFSTGDSRGYIGDGDWSWGFYKGECGMNEPLRGVSRSPSTQGAHALFCLGPAANGQPADTGITLDVREHDHRRDLGLIDWDPGHIKAECGAYEAMSGISQDQNGVIVNARCVDLGGRYRATCNRLYFGDSDVRYSTTGDDWDWGHFKNQCGDSQAIKGVSKESNGRINSILCCTYNNAI